MTKFLLDQDLSTCIKIARHVSKQGPQKFIEWT